MFWSLLFASGHVSTARSLRREPTFPGQVSSVLPALASPPRTFIERLGVDLGALVLIGWWRGEFGQCRGNVAVDEAVDPATRTSVTTAAVATAATGIRPKRHPRSDMSRA